MGEINANHHNSHSMILRRSGRFLERGRKRKREEDLDILESDTHSDVIKKCLAFWVNEELDGAHHSVANLIWEFTKPDERCSRAISCPFGKEIHFCEELAGPIARIYDKDRVPRLHWRHRCCIS